MIRLYSLGTLALLLACEGAGTDSKTQLFELSKDVEAGERDGEKPTQVYERQRIVEEVDAIAACFRSVSECIAALPETFGREEAAHCDERTKICIGLATDNAEGPREEEGVVDDGRMKEKREGEAGTERKEPTTEKIDERPQA